MLLWNRFMPKRDSTSFYLVLLGFLGIALISFSGKGTARFYWAPGHIHQFLNGAVLLFAWYFLAKLLGAGHELKFLRYANLSFIFFSVLLVLVPVIFEDPVSRSAKVSTEISYAIGLGIPIFLTS
jgi:hypothetical protein